MIGIDFDNTIVCYDDVFGRAAAELGLVPPEVATSKTAIRDHLRAAGQEDRWTELQGTIYGPRMIDANPFPGVVAFFLACRAAGIPMAIISHRTRFPYRGLQHDLHAAARDWLAEHGFHDSAGIGLPTERVFFEETQEAKLARIAAVGCTHFIDDLPELLTHPLFPGGVRKLLFAPHAPCEVSDGIDGVATWNDLRTLLVGPTEQLSGGGNNRVYRLDTTAGPMLLKEYFRHPADPRARLGGEQAFSRFAWNHGIRCVPRPLACDAKAGIGLYEFVTGRHLSPQEITATHVEEAAAFFTAVNRHRHSPEAAHLPFASEACFSLAEHLACVEKRLGTLRTIRPDSELHEAAIAIVATQFAPAWNRLRTQILNNNADVDAPLSSSDRVISPSDFGFHNCLATPVGLRFFDFEYAGWDDPAKTVCDFFCQPAVPVAREHLERFLAFVATALRAGDALHDRVTQLLPMYELKWCCIMLNDFLPEGSRRRAFAHGDDSRMSRLAIQLRKVEAALARLSV